MFSKYVRTAAILNSIQPKIDAREDRNGNRSTKKQMPEGMKLAANLGL